MGMTYLCSVSPEFRLFSGIGGPYSNNHTHTPNFPRTWVLYTRSSVWETRNWLMWMRKSVYFTLEAQRSNNHPEQNERPREWERKQATESECQFIFTNIFLLLGLFCALAYIVWNNPLIRLYFRISTTICKMQNKRIRGIFSIILYTNCFVHYVLVICHLVCFCP